MIRFLRYFIDWKFLGSRLKSTEVIHRAGIDPIAGLVEKVDVELQRALLEQHRLNLKDQAEHSARKMAFFKEWSKTENIAKRKAWFEEQQPRALEQAKKMALRAREQLGLPEDFDIDEVLLPERIPSHMRGQARSTILAMLRAYKYDPLEKRWKK